MDRETAILKAKRLCLLGIGICTIATALGVFSAVTGHWWSAATNFVIFVASLTAVNVNLTIIRRLTPP